MAPLRRFVQTVVGACILLVVASCSGSDGATTDPVAAEPEPTATALPEPSPTAVPVPGPTPTGTAEQSAIVGEVIAVELWFPRRGQDGLFADIDREFNTADHPSVYTQLVRVVELWTQGATEDEENAGVLDFDWRFSLCDEPFKVEAPIARAVVTLCSPHIDDDRLVASLEKTLIETGLTDKVAVLTADGQTCAGTPVGDDPLWCLEDGDKRIESFRCPINRARSFAVVSGVDEWANTRLSPSLQGELAGQLRAGQLVTFYPTTLSYDGADHHWVTVDQSGFGQCASVAAHLLEDAFGPLDDITPGITYDLPTTGTWTLDERGSILDRTGWRQEESFATSVSLRIVDGNQIDARLERQLTLYEENGYDFPVDWYEEVDVAGADRAVRYVYVSESGDSGVNVLVAEVDEFTIEAYTSVYIEDRAPNDELDAFLESIAIDRPAFLAAMSAVQGPRVTLDGKEYLPVQEVSGGYIEARACGTPYDYWHIDEFGNYGHAGNLLSLNPSDLGDGYVMWEIYCEGGDPAIFAVAQIEDNGSITRLGSVAPSVLGVRGEYGSHTVNADGSITFVGTAFGGDEEFTDTFQLDDLVRELPSTD